MFFESRWHDDGNRAFGHFFFGDDALDAAVVVDMRVAHHNAHDRALAQVFGNEREGGFGALDAHERIEHDPAGFAGDERDVRHVVAAYLVDSVHHLEEAVQVVELGVAPKTRVCRIGRACGGSVLGIEEGVRLLAPNNFAVLVDDFQFVGGGDETLGGEIAFTLVREIEQRVNGGVGFGRGVGGAFGIGCELKRGSLRRFSIRVFAFAVRAAA